MSIPEFPQPAPGEVLLVSTCYEENGRALWGGLLDGVPGRREGDVLVLDDAAVLLRVAQDPGWDELHGGDVPALAGGGGPPVVVLADLSVARGGGPLLVDAAEIPGRGVRVPPDRLGELLGAVLDGTLTFDDLVRDMDTRGIYQGRCGRPAFAAPTVPLRRSFPALPPSAVSLLVRTGFDDDTGWRALLEELGGADEDGWVGVQPDWGEIDVEQYPLTAVVVDDPAFEDLLPAQVPALVTTGERTILVLLADTRTFTEPGRPLTAVDLWDTPGRSTLLPCHRAGSLACGLELGTTDFHEFVAVADPEPRRAR